MNTKKGSNNKSNSYFSPTGPKSYWEVTISWHCPFKCLINLYPRVGEPKPDFSLRGMLFFRLERFFKGKMS